MNMVLTAPTRPRSASGVRICTRTWRITTLTLSAAPATARAAAATHAEVLRPNQMVAAANTATLQSSTGPARRNSGRNARNPAIRSAPAYGDARSTPISIGPPPSTSSAIWGSSAVAPPKITASMSSRIAPNTGRSRHMCRTPASIASADGAAEPRGEGRGLVAATATANTPQPAAVTR